MVFRPRAARVRDYRREHRCTGGCSSSCSPCSTALATALVYGLGGGLVISGALQIGTLVALVALLIRLYGPISQLSNMQVDVLTALVCFDRVFEVLDLEPLHRRAGAEARPAAGVRGAPGQAARAPEIEFDQGLLPVPDGP